MTSPGSSPADAQALRAAAPPADDLVAVAARARVAASLFGAGASEADGAPRVGDRYEVTGRLGAGGMGVVYEAFDPQLQRKVALKVLHPEVAADDRARQRMLREARSLARLAHPNVIAVHDVGEADDQVFVAMELVDGVTLRAWAESADHGWATVLERYLQAGRGLAAAHHAGLVHRDFKPDNVLVGADGRVRVLDFGLARRAQELSGELSNEVLDLEGAGTGPGQPLARPREATPETTLGEAALTDFGAVVGTPRYMAPEQFDAGVVDAASDQFSFCVSLYEALYGRRPFPAASVAALGARVLAGDFDPAPRGGPIPDSVAEAIERGLAPRKADRWPDLDALLGALQLHLERPGAPSALGYELPPPPVAVPSATWRSFWPAAAIGVGGLVVLLLAPVALWWRPGGTAVALETAPVQPLEADSSGDAVPGRAPTTGDGDGAEPGSASSGLGTGVGDEVTAFGDDGATDSAEDATAGPPGDDGAATDAQPPDPTPPVVRRATDVCHMHEDSYALLHRGRRLTRVRAEGECFACRSERRRSRIEKFTPGDCQAYMVCGPVSSDQCR